MRSEIFQKKVDQAPQNPLFRFSLGQAFFEEGKFTESIPHLEFCAQSKDDWMMARIILGKALLEIDQNEQAKPILEKALQLAHEQHHEDPAEELTQILATL